MFGFGDSISHEVRHKTGKYIRAIVRPQNRAVRRELCYSILGSERVNYLTVNIHLTDFRGHVGKISSRRFNKQIVVRCDSSVGS